MVSGKFSIPQLQLLNPNEKQSYALQFVREVEFLSYKILQDENDRMGNRIEAIIRTARVSVSFTHEEDNNTTRNPNVNDRT